MAHVQTCRCGESIEFCFKCWDPACPAPVCFACVLTASGMSPSEFPELFNAVRPLRAAERPDVPNQRLAMASSNRRAS